MVTLYALLYILVGFLLTYFLTLPLRDDPWVELSPLKTGMFFLFWPIALLIACLHFLGLVIIRAAVRAAGR